MSMNTSVFRNQAGFFITLALLAFVFPSDAEAQVTTRRTDQDVLVMSFNVRWDGFDDGPNDWSTRRDSVIALIESQQPDIIGFQEPSRRQSEDLAGALSGYQIITDSHKRSLHIPIAVRTDRFEVNASGSFWLVDRSPLPGGTRRCTWLRLFDKKTTREIFVYNVHLDGRDHNAHLRAVTELMAHIARRSPTVPFVITGDFNQVESGPGIRYLKGFPPFPNDDDPQRLNPLAVVDTFGRINSTKSGVGTGHGFTGRIDGGRIDYIFVGPTIKVLDASILRDNPFNKFPSDHYPVTARVRLYEGHAALDKNPKTPEKPMPSSRDDDLASRRSLNSESSHLTK